MENPGMEIYLNFPADGIASCFILYLDCQCFPFITSLSSRGLVSPSNPTERCRERKTCIDSNSTRRALSLAGWLADAASAAQALSLSLLPDRLLCVTCITFQPALGSTRSPLSSSIEPLRHIKTCRKADLFSSSRFSVRKILIIESTRKNDGTGRSYRDIFPTFLLQNNSLWGIYNLRVSLTFAMMRAHENFAATLIVRKIGMYHGRGKECWKQRFRDFYIDFFQILNILLWLIFLHG
jgi:hypothetical protein